jgi:hypothetical protein
MEAEPAPSKVKRKRRKGIPERLRFEVFKRDAFTCVYCGRRPPQVVLHCDHRTPQALDGPTTILNLVTACDDCNLGKGAIPLDTQQMLDRHMDDAAKLQEKRRQLKWIEEWYRELAQNDELMRSTIADHYQRHVLGWRLNPDFLNKLARLAQRNNALDCVLDAIKDLAAEHGRTEDGAFTEESARRIGEKLERISRFKISLRQLPNVSQHIDEARYIFGILRRVSTKHLDSKEVFATLDRALARGMRIADLRTLAKQSRSYRDFEESVLPVEPKPRAPMPARHEATLQVPSWPHAEFEGSETDVLEWLRAVDLNFTSALLNARFGDAHMAGRCSRAAGPFKSAVLRGLLTNRDPKEDPQTALHRVLDELDCRPPLDPLYLRLIRRGADGPGGEWVRERFGLAAMNYSLAATAYYIRFWCDGAKEIIVSSRGGPGWIIDQLERLSMPDDGDSLANVLFAPWECEMRQRYALSRFLEHTIQTTLAATGGDFPPELPGLIASIVEVHPSLHFAVDQAVDRPEAEPEPETPHVPLSQRDVRSVLVEFFVNCGGLTSRPTVDLRGQLLRLRDACAAVGVSIPGAFGSWAPAEQLLTEAMLLG